MASLVTLVKNLPDNAGDPGSIPGLGRSPGEGKDNPLQYSCLGYPMDRVAWWAIVHGVSKKSWQRLNNDKNICIKETNVCINTYTYIYIHLVTIFYECTLVFTFLLHADHLKSGINTIVFPFWPYSLTANPTLCCRWLQ